MKIPLLDTVPIASAETSTGAGPVPDNPLDIDGARSVNGTQATIFDAVGALIANPSAIYVMSTFVDPSPGGATVTTITIVPMAAAPS